MRRVYQLMIFLLILMPGTQSSYAQPNSLYFLKGVPQTKDLNPARPGIERGFYISMPFFSKVDLSMNTNNWSYNDLIHQGSGAYADSLVWDFKSYLSSLGKKNFVNESAALTLLEAGWKKGTVFLGFSWTEREFAEPFFTKDLANILYYGNAPYLGNTYSSGYFGVGAQHYREFAFTFSKEMSKKISVGMTGKLLFGMAALKTTGMNFIVGMPVSGDQMDLGATGRAFISAPVDFQLISNNGYHLLSKSHFDRSTYLSNFGNPGFAVDLGFTDKVNPEFEFSMSLVDLGFISWKKDVTVFTENGHFLFRGINLNTVTPTNNPPTTTDAKGLMLALRDSMKVAFFPTETNSGFNTLLPVKLYIAGEGKINENFSIGGVARIRMFNSMIHTSLTASANAALSKNFSLSASYSIMESTFDNLGLAAAFRIGKVQLYGVSDNVFAFYHPSSARNANLRFGINFIFQDEPKQRKGTGNRRQARSGQVCPML
jgi:hypothetical protein